MGFTIKRNEPLYIQVYTILKKSLLNGNFEPGEKLIESKIAEELGVSRSPVREAFRLLEKEELLFHKGNYIYTQKFTRKGILDVYLCRKALESTAAGQAANLITVEEIEQIKKTIRSSRESYIKKDTKSVVKYNTLFHHLIVEASGNKALASLLDTIRARVVYYRNIIIVNYHRDAGIEEHMKIVEALEKRDSTLARKAMEHHIDKDINEFLKILGEKNSL